MLDSSGGHSVESEILSPSLHWILCTVMLCYALPCEVACQQASGPACSSRAPAMTGASGCKDKVQCRFEHAKKTYDFLDWVTFFLPAMGWLRRYNIRQNLLVSFPCCHAFTIWCLIMLSDCGKSQGPLM